MKGIDMEAVPLGTRGERRELVSAGIAVNFLGREEARVLGTPFLIGLLEMTARDSIKPFLPDGFDTVGTEVCIKHLAATPLGMTVTFRSEVVEISDRRVKFRVEAFDEKEKVAEGSHERFVIDVVRFAGRLEAKRSSA
jgi:fluoroacetyl-CoA thioesterase